MLDAPNTRLLCASVPAMALVEVREVETWGRLGSGSDLAQTIKSRFC